MEIKTTTRLFHGKYQYKIVLVSPGAQYFRSGDPEIIAESLSKVKIVPQSNASLYRPIKFSNQDELDYALSVLDRLKKMSDYNIRIESPWISIYSNEKKDIDALSKIDEENVKYISQPNTTLAEGTVLMPNMDFEYRITLGKTIQEHSAFIAWADSNSKLKIPHGARNDLLKPRTWGGKHFYLTGDKNLLVARMHLGGSIAKVERIVKN